VILRAENESLKNENYRLQSALRNILCPNCGGPCIMGPDMGFDDHQLRFENARLKEEVYNFSFLLRKKKKRKPFVSIILIENHAGYI